MPNKNNHNHGRHLKYKICVSGSADTTFGGEEAIAKAEEIGRIIARHNMILVTGATTGIPFWSAKGAKEAGGFVVGLSPAVSKRDHVKNFQLPLDYHDVIVYTGFDYSGRNLLLTRAADAVITLAGRMGTLNEFTIAFEDKKPQGVLLGTDGISDMLQEIVERAKRGPGKIIWSNNPEELVEKVIALIEAEEAGLDLANYIPKQHAEG
ncbi:MAG: hypothetical protein AAB897_00430 [Patescibacteria group bacterium]|mgnify:CR=1 FL=1